MIKTASVEATTTTATQASGMPGTGGTTTTTTVITTERGDRARRAHNAHKVTGGEAGRERERLPRRRTWGGGSRHGGRQHQHAIINTSRPQQLSLFGPLRDKRAIEFQFLFTNRASTLEEAARNFLCRKEGKMDDIAPKLYTSYN